MVKLVKHSKVSTIPDGDDSSLVRPSDWNADHDLTGIAESGANTDITSMSGITGGISSPDYLQLDTTAAASIALGKLRWNDATATASFGIIDGTTEVNIGQQMYAYVTNAEAVTITAGQAVYLYAATGNRASVKLASNLGDSTSAKTLGLVTADIAAGATGFVTTQGVLAKLDTSAFAEGVTLYLGATAGSLTATKPYAPNHLVYIGVVERANAGNGQIYVRPQNGYELDEIHDVQIISPANGQTILYDASTSLWKNANLTAGTGVSITNGAASATITNTAPDQTVVLNNGTGISVTGTYPNFTVTNTSPSSGGTVTSVTATSPVTSTGGTTPVIAMPAATGSVNGYLTSTDWTTFNDKGNGTVTSVAALTLGTTGTDLSSTVATGTTTPVITLNVPTASASNRGVLSSADWTTFNGKQASLGYTPVNKAGDTMTGALALAAGTASLAPLDFATGTNLTTAQAGAMEFDGTAPYFSIAASTRGVLRAEQIVVLTSGNTMTSQIGVQPIFDGGGGPTNGAVTLPVGTYQYECSYAATNLSATAGSFGFGLGGTATKTFTAHSLASKTGTTLVGVMATTSTFSTAANAQLTNNSTGTVCTAFVKGIIRVTVAGTIIPQISMTVASACVVEANSYFKISPIGNSTVVSVGNWS